MICHHCKNPNVKLRRVLARNGVSMVAWYCLRCQHWAAKPHRWIPKAAIEQMLSDWNRRKPYRVTLEMIPLLSDYRAECEACGASGAEWHHWFPTSLRATLTGLGHSEEDLYRWEHFQALLCPICHRLWHEAVTPYLPGYKGRPLANEMQKLLP